MRTHVKVAGRALAVLGGLVVMALLGARIVAAQDSHGSVVARGRSGYSQGNAPEPNAGFVPAPAGVNHSFGPRGYVCGDLDFDRDVDLDDYQLFLVAFGHYAGEPGYNPAADCDGDGCTTLLDYRIWRERYMQGGPRDELGACCYGELGECIITDEVTCRFAPYWGEWVGPGTDCNDGDGSGIADVCELGACCQEEGGDGCVVEDFNECQNEPVGVWRWVGPGTDCDDDDDVEGPDFCGHGVCCYGEEFINCSEGWYDNCGTEYVDGVWMGAGTVCDDANGNKIADECEPLVVMGACCYDEEPGGPLYCVVTAQIMCENQGGFFGQWFGPGSDCEDVDQNGLADVCEALGGACCYGESGQECTVTDWATCTQVLLGHWMGAATTCEDVNQNEMFDACEPAACCYGPDGADCAEVDQYTCTWLLTGQWHGLESTCADDDDDGTADVCEPPPLGACCTGPGTECLPMTEYWCVNMIGGQWMGAGTTCEDTNGNLVPDICEPPDWGACCYWYVVLGCTVVDPLTCEQFYLGEHMGPGTDCANLNGNDLADVCEQLPIGACCRTPYLCDLTFPFSCDDLGGQFMGDGTDCEDWDGDGFPDICGPVGDLDGDGYVDWTDFSIFASCITAPGVEAPPECGGADLDGADGDVDLADFAVFQQHFTGPPP